MNTKFYLFFVWSCVEPKLIGPFETAAKRDRHARALYRQHGDAHGYFRQDVREIAGDIVMDAHPYRTDELVCNAEPDAVDRVIAVLGGQS